MSIDHASVTRYAASSRSADDVVVISDGPLRVVARVESALHQATIEMIGELDIGGVEVVEMVFRRTERSGMPVVLLDLSALHFTDLAGVRRILAADARLRRRGRRLVLLRPPPESFTVFAITGADRQLTFLD
jgi:anti-anti-sigma factor